MLEASGAVPDGSKDVPKGFEELLGVRPSVAGALEWLQESNLVIAAGAFAGTPAASAVLSHRTVEVFG